MKPVLLVYCFYAPWPMAMGSSQRMHEMFHELRKDFVLVLYCGHGSLPEDAHHPFDHVYQAGFLRERLGKVVKLAAVQRGLWTLIRMILAGFFRMRTPSFLATAYYSTQLCNVTRKIELSYLAREHRVAALLGEYVWTMPDAAVVTNVCRIPIIIDTHDVLSNRAETEAKLGMDAPWHDIDRLSEIAFWTHADLLIAIQKKEMDVIKSECPNTPVVLAEHGVVVAEGGNTGREEIPNRVLCVASSAKPNLHGLRLFLENQWSQVAALVPDAEFHLVGAACAELGGGFAGMKGLFLHGPVDDLSPYYEMASVTINPVVYGSGLKIKTVEAIAYRKCLLSTPVGGEGLEEHFNVSFHVADPHQLGEELVGLLRDPALRDRYRKGAADLHLTRFHPRSCYASLGKALLELVSR